MLIFLLKSTQRIRNFNTTLKIKTPLNHKILSGVFKKIYISSKSIFVKDSTSVSSLLITLLFGSKSR